MPKGIREPLERLRGLPTDADINGWCIRLGLAIDAIKSEREYDRYLIVDGEPIDESQEELYTGQIELYQSAIDALNALLPDDEQPETPA